MPPMLKRVTSAIFVVLCATVALLAFGGAASAYPPGTAPTLSESHASGAPGSSVFITGDNFTPGTADITFHSTPVSLGTVTVGADGKFATTVKIPSDATAGTHTIIVSDAAGDTASVTFTVTAGGGGGGLAGTGVAVIGIATLGVALLVGGGLMVLAGRRRKVAA